ncbi:hypothetical protein HanRHA438_Chr06g0256621 [Helianthus annuus]|nr:hypothetical protein HanRHA438_Chr06g0256621 [Helianthus annuus]
MRRERETVREEREKGRRRRSGAAAHGGGNEDRRRWCCCFDKISAFGWGSFSVRHSSVTVHSVQVRFDKENRR